jgi:hypothetical protein
MDLRFVVDDINVLVLNSGMLVSDGISLFVA